MFGFDEVYHIAAAAVEAVLIFVVYLESQLGLHDESVKIYIMAAAINAINSVSIFTIFTSAKLPADFREEAKVRRVNYCGPVWPDWDVRA